jgi:hypothetical protein
LVAGNDKKRRENEEKENVEQSFGRGERDLAVVISLAMCLLA